MATKRSSRGKQGRTSKSPEQWLHQFLIVLANTDTVVWRRIQVPSRYSFWDLHVAIQDAMGWLDCHLHEFVVVPPDGGRIERLGIPGDEFIDERPCRPDWNVAVSHKVNENMSPMLYLYDCGDDWRHAVIYEGQAQADPAVMYPRCLSGARKCPPEDCGGVHGYAEFLTAIANRKHPDHAPLRQWAGGEFDPAEFDPTAIEFDDPRKRWKIAFTDRRDQSADVQAESERHRPLGHGH